MEMTNADVLTSLLTFGTNYDRKNIYSSNILGQFCETFLRTKCKSVPNKLEGFSLVSFSSLV